MLLVDSTLYMDWLRARRDPVEVMKPWLARDEVISCGVIRCEVLRGIIRGKVRERMKALFEVLPVVETDESTWDRTAALTWTLDRRGVVLPLTDVLIAVCAIRAGAAVVSTDEHFQHIPHLLVLPSLPTS